MTMPKPDEWAKELFKSLMPQDDPRVQTRPMFGNLAGFVNGNMFTGLYGNDVFVRLPDEAKATLLRDEADARVLEPMPGRPMREYVVLPQAWQSQPERMQDWIDVALNWTATLRAKEPKGAKPAPPKAKKKA